MLVVKGGQIYQTFSLAKSNESGGKKSRIRRSKEERKEMAVSFIKKYQSLNNGSFPSLNLTHKEVGGSFYTVREIVRDIIQENRVLGPAKLLPGEHNNDEFLEQYPLGTISTQPHSSSSMSPNGSPLAHDQQESINDDLHLISDGLSTEVELEGFVNGKVTNGNHVLVKNKESVKQNVDGQVSKMQETEENIKGVTISMARVTQIADVVVETFPLRPVIKQTDYLDGESGELKGLNKTLEENDVEITHLGPGNDVSLPDGLTSSNNTFVVYDEVENLAVRLSERNCDLLDGKLVGSFELPKLESLTLSTSLQDNKYEKGKHVLLERSSGLVDKSGENLVEIPDPILEASNLSTTREGSVHEESACALLDGQSVENLVCPTLGSSDSASVKEGVVLVTQFDLDIETVAKNQVTSTPNGAEAKRLDYTHASGKSTAQDVVVESNAGGSTRLNNPTLTRIDLESWRRASKNPTEPKTHSLWDIFKSILAALMKFLSQ